MGETNKDRVIGPRTIIIIKKFINIEFSIVLRITVHLDSSKRYKISQHSLAKLQKHTFQPHASLAPAALYEEY